MHKHASVLIVDDNYTLREIMVKIVKKLGFHPIREAKNGQEAWTIIVNSSIDLIITDLNMPVTGGLGLIHQVRAHVTFKKIPILVMTTDHSEETIVKSAHLGVDGYILKPFKAKEIAKQIQDAKTRRQYINEN